MENEVAAAQRAERTRIREILESDAARGRWPLAHHLAFESNLSASEVLAALEAANRYSEPLRIVAGGAGVLANAV